MNDLVRINAGTLDFTDPPTVNIELETEVIATIARDLSRLAEIPLLKPEHFWEQTFVHAFARCQEESTKGLQRATPGFLHRQADEAQELIARSKGEKSVSDLVRAVWTNRRELASPVDLQEAARRLIKLWALRIIPDYNKSGDIEAIAEAATLALASPVAVDKIYRSIADYLADPPVADLIAGVLPEHGVHVLFGGSNSFKSFAAIDMGLSVAFGLSWHGCFTKPGKVLFLLSEDAHASVTLRMVAWLEAHDLTPANAEGQILIRTLPVAFNSPTELARFRMEIERMGIDFVITDLLAATFKGSDSDMEVAADWVRGVQLLFERRTMLAIAHTGWSDTSRIRGSTHLWGSFGTRLLAEGDKEARKLTVTVDRHKNKPSGQWWTFDLQIVDIERSEETSLILRLEGSGSAASAPRTTDRDPRTVDILRANYLSALDLLAEDIDDSPGPDFTRVFKVESEAINRDLVRRGDLMLKDPAKLEGGLDNKSRAAVFRARKWHLEKRNIVFEDPYVWRPRN